MPLSAGMASKNDWKAARPPAEATSPTTGRPARHLSDLWLAAAAGAASTGFGPGPGGVFIAPSNEVAEVAVVLASGRCCSSTARSLYPPGGGAARRGFPHNTCLPRPDCPPPVNPLPCRYGGRDVEAALLRSLPSRSGVLHEAGGSCRRWRCRVAR